MTEIERLRQDIEKLEAAVGIIGNMSNENNTTAHMQRILKMQRQKLSRIEAEAAAKADPWAQEKESVAKLCEPEIRPFPALTPEETRRIRASHAARYVKHLQDRVAELEQQEYKDIEKMFNLERELSWRNARIAALEDEISRSQVWVIKDNDLVIEGPFFTSGFANERAKLIRSRISDTCTVEPWKGGA